MCVYILYARSEHISIFRSTLYRNFNINTRAYIKVRVANINKRFHFIIESETIRTYDAALLDFREWIVV